MNYKTGKKYIGSCMKMAKFKVPPEMKYNKIR